MPETRTGLPESRLISSLLAGAWRETPPAPEISAAELELIAPLLIASGGGALAFWKLRHHALARTQTAVDLKQVYRLYTLQAAIHERELEQVIRLLNSEDIEPILVKGWSMARHYPEPALRPYGDIDLFVRPQDFERAEKILASEEGKKFFVDLHRGADHLDEQSFESLFARSETVKLGAASFRVLSPEDHLRVLCVHFLHHGAWRPAGLCDIALLVEASRANFDWEICLTRNRKRAGWIICTIGLAHQLLGADLKGTPVEETARKLPRWLVPAVLKEWDNPVSVDHTVPPPLAKRLAHPFETLTAIRKRWPPNPIQATVVMNGPFNEWPRIIFQAGNYLTRTVKFLSGLPKYSKHQSRLR